MGSVMLERVVYAFDAGASAEEIVASYPTLELGDGPSSSWAGCPRRRRSDRGRSAGTVRDGTVEFFDAQFRRQIREGDYALNPFETRALEHLAGTVLDLGCGLGNLSLEAARRGHRVVAVDSSADAVERIRADAGREGLPVRALRADVERWRIEGRYDTVVAIGLLMFFPRERALALLRTIQEHVEPGGIAVVNVLVEGTTFLGMFEGSQFYLFGRDELEERFAGWRILSSRHDTFPAPGGTRKEFSTVVAQKPDRTP